MKRMWPVLLAVFAIFGFAQDQHQHGASGAAGLGTVTFPTSCAPGAQGDFNHAVALLHSFEYSRARDAFLSVAKADPGCAIAHWGAAMTYFHAYWGEIDVEAGRREVAAARQIAKENPNVTAREKQYIEAAAAIYENEDATFGERAKALTAHMAQVRASNPNDDEASIFYAFSLHASAGRDLSYANDRQCGEILEPLFRKLPNHPGIAHYLIHCYDNPVLAEKGLEAARKYATIAPDSAHATHMPSHIFVRLGLWQDTVNSNVAAMEVAERQPDPCHDRSAELHAMHFLQFAYLQLGKRKEAADVAERALKLPNANGCEPGEYVAASFALDAHDWDMANRLPGLADPRSAWAPEAEVVWEGIGVAAARSGNIARAQRAAQALAEWRDRRANETRRPTEAFDGPRLVVAAWISETQQDHAQALRFMQKAADAGLLADESTWVHPPSKEQLGDLLIQQHKPQEALAAYRKELEITPNLFNALYGAARAAEAAGDQQLAISYYRKLTEVAGGGDRPEIESARKKLEVAQAPAVR